MKYKSIIVLGCSLLVGIIGPAVAASGLKDEINAEQITIKKVQEDVSKEKQFIDEVVVKLIQEKEILHTLESNQEELILTRDSFKETIDHEETYIERVASGNSSIQVHSGPADAFETIKRVEEYKQEEAKNDEKLMTLNQKVETSKIEVTVQKQTIASLVEKQQVAQATLKELIAKKDTADAKLKELKEQQKKKTSEIESTEVLYTNSSSSSGFSSPLSGNLTLTSGFGGRQDPTGYSGTQHDGIDFSGTNGQKILAARSGKVIQNSFDASAGNYIILAHDNGYYSYYMHLTNSNVAVGSTVETGQVIGFMGSTGNSTGTHLHFGISTSIWSDFVDPTTFLAI